MNSKNKPPRDAFEQWLHLVDIVLFRPIENMLRSVFRMANRHFANKKSSKRHRRPHNKRARYRR